MTKITGLHSDIIMKKNYSIESEISEEELLDKLWEEQSSYNPKNTRQQRRESSKSHKKYGRNESRWN